MSELTIIHPGQPCLSDQNLAKLAQFMGVTTSFLPAAAAVSQSSNGIGERNRLLAGTVAAIGPLLKAPRFFDQVKAIFLYSPGQSKTDTGILSTLTNGAVTAVAPVSDQTHQISFSANCDDITFQFSGLEFPMAPEGRHSVFVISPGVQPLRHLMCLDGAPFFAESNFLGADVLLLGASDLTDIDGPFIKGQPVMQQFKSLIPPMMFLRKYAGNQCWHPSSYQAALVIDDPLVRPRYGYVDFTKLRDDMERRQYAASLAFIPWNYRRSDKKTAELFQQNSNRLSISIHGCDHNLAEFGVTDEAQLCWKGKTALKRMDRHAQAFQTRFDKVMVFPQGIFSSVSMDALQRCGFEAVANATPHPVDKPGDFLSMRDMLEGALTRFSNFALFLRRSHHSVPIAAFDLFLGRPVIFFTHHQDFRDQGEQISLLAERVNALPGPIHWRSLGEACARASLQRFDVRGILHFRAYTDRFIVKNPGDVSQPSFFYRSAGPDPVDRILINGKSVEGGLEEGYVKIPFTLQPGETVEVRLERSAPTCFADGYHQNFLDKTSIFFRRHLSEFRANFVDTLDIAQPLVRFAGKLIHGRK